MERLEDVLQRLRAGGLSILEPVVLLMLLQLLLDAHLLIVCLVERLLQALEVLVGNALARLCPR